MFERFLAGISIPGFVFGIFKVYEYMWTPEPIFAIMFWLMLFLAIVENILKVFGVEE